MKPENADISTMNREERRKLSRAAIQKVRAEGIQIVPLSVLETCLFGIGTQIQVRGLIDHDKSVIQGMSTSCLHAGSIYEQVRCEILRRISMLSTIETCEDEIDECSPIQNYPCITWDEANKKLFRRAQLEKWHKKPTDENAMLYTLACMPLPVWHWRMYKLYKENFIPALPLRLHYIALKNAGVKGYDCCQQGLDFMELSVSRRAKISDSFPIAFDDINPWSGESNDLEDDNVGMRLWREAFRWEK